MCKIKFKETFRINVGLLDLSKKSYLRKTVKCNQYYNRVFFVSYDCVINSLKFKKVIVIEKTNRLFQNSLNISDHLLTNKNFLFRF